MRHEPHVQPSIPSLVIVNRRLLRAAVGTTIGLGLLLGGGAAAFAGEPRLPAATGPVLADEPTVDLGGASVVDTTGKAGDLTAAETAIDALKARAGLSLVVVYVANFDDSSADEDSG